MVVVFSVAPAPNENEPVPLIVFTPMLRVAFGFTVNVPVKVVTVFVRVTIPPVLLYRLIHN